MSRAGRCQHAIGHAPLSGAGPDLDLDKELRALGHFSQESLQQSLTVLGKRKEPVARVRVKERRGNAQRNRNITNVHMMDAAVKREPGVKPEG